MDFIRRARLSKRVLVTVHKIHFGLLKLHRATAKQKSEDQYVKRKQPVPKRKLKCSKKSQ